VYDSSHPGTPVPEGIMTSVPTGAEIEVVGGGVYSGGSDAGGAVDGGGVYVGGVYVHFGIAGADKERWF